jgi:hypothetical protein
MLSDYWVDHGECFLLICGLFFFRKFTNHIGCKLVLIKGFQIEGFPIDEEFVAGCTSWRARLDTALGGCTSFLRQINLYLCASTFFLSILAGTLRC